MKAEVLKTEDEYFIKTFPSWAPQENPQRNKQFIPKERFLYHPLSHAPNTDYKDKKRILHSYV